MNFDLNSLSDEEKRVLLFGILLGDGRLSHYITNQGREGFAICITGHYYDDKEFFDSIVFAPNN